MRLPDVPSVRPTDSISPSLYDDAVLCNARAAWRLYGQRRSIPPHPSALLGQGYHGVMEAAVRGQLSEESSERENSARDVFDALMAKIFEESHPIIKIKFRAPHRLPYYNLFKERAAQKAREVQSRLRNEERSSSNAGEQQPNVYVETEFVSRDRVIKGRPDYVDRQEHTVVDYKSGAARQLGDGELKANEERQVLLYGYLLSENGIEIRKGRIERADGRTAEIAISNEAAQREGERAREVLAAFNQSASAEEFQALTSPSPLVCASCPCIAVCPAFWQASNNTWQDAVGVHLEGTIAKKTVAFIGGVEIATLIVEVSGGTLPEGQATVEQIPTAWMGEDQSLYDPGARIRITDAKLVSADPVIVRADNVMTSIWTPK